TLPLGPLPPDPLLVYGVGHKKQIRKAIKSTGIIAKSQKLKDQKLKLIPKALLTTDRQPFSVILHTMLLFLHDYHLRRFFIFRHGESLIICDCSRVRYGLLKGDP
ncbi:MAG: hypothetical protein EZS28_030621, partial [Streblomastix strix]